MFVKPSDDPSRAVVLDPATMRQLPREGAEKPDHHPYWLKLLEHGDVVRAAPPAPAAEPNPAPAPSAEHP